MKNKISAIVFLIFIGIFAAGYFIVEDREFSDMENRYLTTMPKFSLDSFANGTFTSDFESYMADQVIFKDNLVTLKTDLSRLCNMTQVNGVYFGEEDYLIQDYEKPTELLDSNLNYIKTFAQRNEIPMTMLLVPNASYIYEDKMPLFGETYPQDAVISQVRDALSSELTFVDASDILLEHKEESIYFKTDHHWTMEGAYYGYQVLGEALNISVTNRDDYEIEVVSEDFYGSMYSKAPSAGQSPDVISIYHNPEGIYQVEYLDEEKTTDSLFVYENLEIKDQYTVFLGGNHPLLHITSNSENEENVLVIKDSYAHCLLPMLADHYSSMYVMDLRYYHSDIDAFIEENNIEQVIFIYNVEFLSTDNNFLWLK